MTGHIVAKVGRLFKFPTEDWYNNSQYSILTAIPIFVGKMMSLNWSLLYICYSQATDVMLPRNFVIEATVSGESPQENRPLRGSVLFLL